MERFVKDINAEKIKLNKKGKNIVKAVFEAINREGKGLSSWKKTEMFMGGIDCELNLQGISTDTKYEPKTGVPRLPRHKKIYKIPRKIAIAAMKYTYTLPNPAKK